MPMPGRSVSSSAYRYGFNGKENDNEVKGTGNQQDYGMRVYDPRLGKFLSVDPISKQYPELSPYQFASNTPIWAVDIDGLEAGLYGSGGMTLDAAEKQSKAIENWSSSPAESWMKRGLSAQINYSQSGTNFKEGDFTNLTKGGYYLKSFLFSLNYWAPSNPGNLKIPNTRQPQMPQEEVHVSIGKPKQAVPNQVEISEKINVQTASKQQITAKRTDSQTGFSQQSKEFRGAGYNLVGGQFQARGKGMSGAYDFVVTQDGKLLLGHGHYYISKEAPTVQAAGVLEMYNGKVKTISNNSGHYQPSAQETNNFKSILTDLGVDVSGAKVKTVEHK